jgi:hypothetical protein
MPHTTFTILADTTELEEDLERIENGDLSTPTVSAVGIVVDGKRVDDVLIYFP